MFLQSFYLFLVVYVTQFKEGLGMTTDRAFLGSFFAFQDKTTVTADPGLLFSFFEDGLLFHVVEQG